MKTLIFITNIQCGACVATVSKVLNSESKISNWEVDIQNPKKPLTVTTDLSPSQVIQLVEKAGYKASES